MLLFSFFVQMINIQQRGFRTGTRVPIKYRCIFERKYKCVTIEKTPEMIQTMRAALTDPVFIKTPVGETKIPDPIILPTITVTPFSRLILGLRVISSSPDFGEEDILLIFLQRFTLFQIRKTLFVPYFICRILRLCGRGNVLIVVAMTRLCSHVRNRESTSMLTVQRRMLALPYALLFLSPLPFGRK